MYTYIPSLWGFLPIQDLGPFMFHPQIFPGCLHCAWPPWLGIRRYVQITELRGRRWLQAQERPEEVVCLIWVWRVYRSPTEGWHAPEWRLDKESSGLSNHVRRLGLRGDAQKGSVKSWGPKGRAARSRCVFKFSWRHWPWPLRLRELWLHSYPFCQGRFWTYSCWLVLLIVSPLENPGVNPEILVAIRKEYEDQSREKMITPFGQKGKCSLRCTAPWGQDANRSGQRSPHLAWSPEGWLKQVLQVDLSPPLARLLCAGSNVSASLPSKW